MEVWIYGWIYEWKCAYECTYSYFRLIGAIVVGRCIWVSKMSSKDQHIGILVLLLHDTSQKFPVSQNLSVDVVRG
jgi:hypothetical protein